MDVNGGFHGHQWVDAAAIAACSCLLLRSIAGGSERVRIRVRRRPRPTATVSPAIGRAVSALGFALAFGSSPAAAGTRAPVTPDRRLRDAAPPWSDASGFPPPRPLARTEAVADTASATHPAVHGRASADRDRPEIPPLFPREAPREGARARSERAASMARHPSGKGRTAISKDHHVVRPGESLWAIAAETLATDDVREIARYWPLIHRANRSVIGTDPSLIRPGQVLQLPARH